MSNLMDDEEEDKDEQQDDDADEFEFLNVLARLSN